MYQIDITKICPLILSREIIAICSKLNKKTRTLVMLAKCGDLNLLFGPTSEYSCTNLEGVYFEE
jgi:hypothetical protein